MKTNVKKELIICVITLIVLLITMTQTFASQTITDANEIRNLVSGNTNKLTNENATNIIEGENRNNTVNNTANNTTNNTVNNTTNNTTNNTVNNSNKNELPDTGLDTPSIAIVAICIISAIYAYKKIIDYKNI